MARVECCLKPLRASAAKTVRASRARGSGLNKSPLRCFMNVGGELVSAVGYCETEFPTSSGVTSHVVFVVLPQGNDTC